MSIVYKVLLLLSLIVGTGCSRLTYAQEGCECHCSTHCFDNDNILHQTIKETK